MLAKMLRDMPQNDGLRVLSAPAAAMAASYAMFGNWIVVLLVWVEENWEGRRTKRGVSGSRGGAGLCKERGRRGVTEIKWVSMQ
jgi:hypothetical protein